MGVGIDFTDNEIEAIERVGGWGASDDADMRHAIHAMIIALARYREIDISDIDLDEGVDDL